MNQMGFNVLRRAQDSEKINNSLNVFLKERGVNIEQVTSNPKYYQDLLMEYSKQHISTEIYEETRERMEVEFNRLCDFRRMHEDELVKRFFEMTNERVMNDLRKKKYQK